MSQRLIQRITLSFVISMLLALGIAHRGGVTAQTSEQCFPETGYCISGRIREYWEQNGGLYVFGYPITPQRPEIIESRSFEVQWFERNRLELHPENARPYDVLLGRLGDDAIRLRGRDWTTFPQDVARDGCRFFPETRQNVCGLFLQAWRRDGLELDGLPGKTEAENLALFGLPLSPPQTEVLSDGREYVVQWFERARFESHPENNPPFNVLFGLLGTEVRALQQLPTQTPTAQFTATPTQTSVPSVTPSSTSTPTAPFEGQIVFVSERDGRPNIYVMDADGTRQTRLTDEDDTNPVWSPNGRRIAFETDRDGNREIYVMDADGSDLTNLTDNSADDMDPAWSPDGNRIAFTSDRDGDLEIYLMDVDGSDQVNISSHPARDRQPAWSPDGDEIVFTSNRDDNDNIYMMNTDGTDPQALTGDTADDYQPAWSLDGDRIAFTSDRNNNTDIYTVDPDGERLRRVTERQSADFGAAWSPDSDRLAYTSERDGNEDIYVVDEDGDNPVRLTTNDDDDWAPDWTERER